MSRTPFGVEMPYRALMEIRVFDAFAHEQDIRRATGRNGNLTGPAAAIAPRQMVAIWSMISRRFPSWTAQKWCSRSTGSRTRSQTARRL